MKTKILLLAILVFCFGTSFCMAKTTVLVTPLVFSPPGGADFVFCTFSNSGDPIMNLTISVFGMDGTELNTGTFPLPGHNGVTLPAVTPSTTNYYYCTFSIQGKGKAGRGMLQVSTNGRVYVTVPAN